MAHLILIFSKGVLGFGFLHVVKLFGRCDDDDHHEHDGDDDDDDDGDDE